MNVLYINKKYIYVYKYKLHTAVLVKWTEF